MQSTRLVRCLIRAAAALVACSCGAQVMQNRGALPGGGHYRFPSGASPSEVSTAGPQPAQATGNAANATPNSAPAAATTDTEKASATALPPTTVPPALPPSLLDKPAVPARVTLSGGRLSVEAANSSLSQILDAVEATSGMTVDGLGKKEQRVFGHYGPGTPRDVLSALLDGAGYNFMMVGATDSGTPRTIILTQNSSMPAATIQGSGEPQPEDEEPPQANNSPAPLPPVTPRPSNVLSPPDAAGRVRTPQEILQELERMRAQQNQQQSPQ